MTAEGKKLQKEYALRFSQMAEYRKTVWRILIDHYFQSRVGENQIILDLGSGWGEFINQVQASKKYAMDLNPDASQRVNSDVNLLQQDCSAHWDIQDNSLDVIFTSNFFEHLPTKSALLATLQQAHRCLKPGGRIICLGPNIRYVGNAYWDFIDHYIELTHLSLAEALQMTDFTVAESIPRFLPYTMAQGKNPSLWKVKLYLKLPIFWRLLGKQFLLTAVKRVD